MVFWDRIECRALPMQLLAHVMVHEITHPLEGISRHSETGVMKVNWTEDDVKTIKLHPMKFAAEDVELIHRGLTVRSATLASVMAAGI